MQRYIAISCCCFPRFGNARDQLLNGFFVFRRGMVDRDRSKRRHSPESVFISARRSELICPRRQPWIQNNLSGAGNGATDAPPSVANPRTTKRALLELRAVFQSRIARAVFFPPKNRQWLWGNGRWCEGARCQDNRKKCFSRFPHRKACGQP